MARVQINLKGDFRSALKLAVDSDFDNSKTLADKIGVSYVTLSRWMNGNHVPDKKYWRRIYDVLEIDIRKFVI